MPFAKCEKIAHYMSCIYHLKDGVENIALTNVTVAIEREVEAMKNFAGGPVNIIIIVLGHGGYTFDQMLARTVEGVDLVIGGHSHTFLFTGQCLYREECVLRCSRLLICFRRQAVE